MYYATVYPIQNYTLLFPVGQDSGFYPEIAGYNRIELSSYPHLPILVMFQALFDDPIRPAWRFPVATLAAQKKWQSGLHWSGCMWKLGYNTMVSYIMESTSRISDHNIP